MNRLCVVVAMLAFTALPAFAENVLITRVIVVDGTGAPPLLTDVRIRHDRIVAVGNLRKVADEIVIDASGLALAPGFIDTHSHHDELLGRKPDVLPAVSQGITTIVVGQDGGSELPLSRFFAKRTRRPAAANIAAYSGHNTLRDAVLGKNFKRQATPADIERMRILLATDMRAGALGLSTDLEYDPGIHSSADEVVTLARQAAASGGRYVSHIRSEDRGLWQALDELVEIGRRARILRSFSKICSFTVGGSRRFRRRSFEGAPALAEIRTALGTSWKAQSVS